MNRFSLTGCLILASLPQLGAWRRPRPPFAGTRMAIPCLQAPSPGSARPGCGTRPTCRRWRSLRTAGESPRRPSGTTPPCGTPAPAGPLVFRNGHRGAKVSCRRRPVSPDGSLFAWAAPRTANWACRRRLGGRILHRLGDRKAPCQGLVFSRDNRWLASADRDGNMWNWDLRSGKSAHRFKFKPDDFWRAFTPDGKTFIRVGVDDITFHDVRTGKEKQRIRSKKKDEWPVGVAVSPDGKLLACGGSDHAIHLWGLASGKERFPFEHGLGGRPWARFLSDGKTILIHCRYDVNRTWWTIHPRLSCWDLQGNFLREIVLQPGVAHALALSGDGRTVAYAIGSNFRPPFQPIPNRELESKIQVWDEPSGRQIDKVDLEPCQIHDLTFSPDGRFLLVNASNAGSTPDSYDRVDTLQIWKRNRVKRLVNDLDSDSYRAREDATKELIRLAELAEDALRRAVVGRLSAEARRRVTRVLDELPAATAPPQHARDDSVAGSAGAHQHARSPQADNQESCPGRRLIPSGSA